MRIGFLSDVHVHRPEHAADVDALVDHINAHANLQLLVCAGDISDRLSQVEDFLGRVDPGCPRAWVPGNHDVWVIEAEHDRDTSDWRYDRGLAAISRRTGWHYLPAGPLDTADGWRVCGTIGWITDDGFSEWFDGPAGERDQLIAARMAADLDQQFVDDRRHIVVLHHVPDRRLLPPDAPPRAEVNDHLWPILQAHANRIDLVIHGHHHRRYEPRTLDGLTCVAHPFGYPRQHTSVADGFCVMDLLTLPDATGTPRPDNG